MDHGVDEVLWLFQHVLASHLRFRCYLDPTLQFRYSKVSHAGDVPGLWSVAHVALRPVPSRYLEQLLWPVPGSEVVLRGDVGGESDVL